MTPGARRAASSLVIAEIALATVLLAGAGLTIRSIANLLAVDPGFTPAGVLTLQLALPDGRYPADDARRAFYAAAFRELEALPEIEAVGAAMVTPLTGNNWTVPLQRADRALPPGQRPPDVGWQMASRGYFAALHIPLRSGGCSSPSDATGPGAVIVERVRRGAVLPRRAHRRPAHPPRRHDRRDRRRGRRRAPRLAHRHAARRPVLPVRARQPAVDDAVRPHHRRSAAGAARAADGGPPARAARGDLSRRARWRTSPTRLQR